MAENTAGKQRGKPFKPGQSGNPLGRPKGSRSKLGEDFVSALYADFQSNGVSAIERVRTEKPEHYLKVIASLMPKEMVVSTDPIQDATDEELGEMLKYLRTIGKSPLKREKPH